jgi:hypothetical protein
MWSSRLESELAGETEVFGENLPQYNFAQHFSRDLTWDRNRIAALKAGD